MSKNRKPMPALHLSAGQGVVLATYCGGEFSHLADAVTQQEFDEQLAEVGDGLFRFLMVELAQSEDCRTVQEALSRVETAIRDLEEVSAALQIQPEQIEGVKPC